MSAGCVGRQPPHKAQGPLGASGGKERPTTSATKNSKGRTKPQSGTTFRNAVETSKPRERFRKKTKRQLSPVRQDGPEREGAPGFSEAAGTVKEK